jgi:hypothetical protein
MRCGITNLASCIPEKIYEFIINLLNAPIQPLLTFIESLLTDPVNLTPFISLWAIMLYIISLFYGLLMLYSGFNFMLSGHDVVKRTKAKEWFKNILIMVVLVQASYFLYELVVDIGSLLSAGIIGLIDSHFFLITLDNLANIGLQFFFTFFYVLTLLFTILFLTFRYIIIAFGVVFIPIGIFFYFIPPLKNYGKLIINFLGTSIFLGFFMSVILLVSSKLLEIALFQNFKILVMISAFSLANFFMFYFMFFSAIKSAFNTAEKTSASITSVIKYFG